MNLKQTASELQWKANQLRAEAAKYESAAQVLEGLDQTSAKQVVSAATGIDPEPKGKRKISTSARRRISEAQKTRWAKWKKAKKAGKVLQFGKSA